MVIDAHGHLGHWSFPVHSLTTNELITQMDQYGIDCTIVSSSLAVRYDITTGNAQLYEELQQYPRIKGYVTVNLNYPKESIAELNRYFDNRHNNTLFVGVKIHPMMNQRRFDSITGLLIAEAIAAFDVPILIHTYGSDMESPHQIVEVIKRFPNLKIILAHSGGFDWHLAQHIAHMSDTVYAELCSSCTSSDKVHDLITSFGPHRVLFGTDTTLFHPSFALGMVKEAQLKEEVSALIMGENAKKIFRLHDC